MVQLFALLLSRAARHLGLKIVEATFLDAFSDLIRGESAALTSIEGKLERIMAEAFSSGLDYLNIARKAPENRRLAAIETAREHFVRAKNLESLRMNAARANVYVGLCSDLLEEPGNAVTFYEHGHSLFMAHERILLEGDSRWFSSAMNALVMNSSCVTLRVSQRIKKITRREMLQRFVSAYDNLKQHREIFDEFYGFARPLNDLLIARNSTLKSLVPSSQLTFQNIPARSLRYTEDYCGITFSDQ